MREKKLQLLLAIAFSLPIFTAIAQQAHPTHAEQQKAIVNDWLLQDHGKDFKKQCFISKTGAQIEKQLIERVLKELPKAGEDLMDEVEELALAEAPGSDPRWRQLYIKACEKRRSARLQPLLAKWQKIVFTKHYDLGGSHYAYTEGQSDAQSERHFRPGASLCMLELNGTEAKVRTLIDDPRGVIRDPDVSYDGTHILFAWKKSDRKDDYHLYEMEAKTGEVKQVTSGLGFADYEGAYLPDDNIIFNSTRSVQTVDCWWTEVSNLYTADRKGRYLRRLGFDQVHTNFPAVLDDGRVIYTRWDYNDRGQIYPQPLFQMNADGTGQTEFYGNNSYFPTTILHARGIPGTKKVLAVMSGHHTHQRGKLGIIDTTKGRQEASGVQLIAPVRETKAARIDAYGQNGDQFQYPYPLNETSFLVTYSPDCGGNRRYRQRFGIYFMTIDGQRELLVSDPKISCSQPVPLAARQRPHARPGIVDYSKKTGTYYIQDVYNGPGLKGIKQGSVKKIRVVALDFRAAGIGSNSSRGPAGGAMVSTPVSIGNGSWDVKSVLGTAKVYEDGSACFEVPARTPVYFQALDEKGHMVQTMRSWSTLMPGEFASCTGCHEYKNQAPSSYTGSTQAMKAGPQPLDDFYGPPRGFSFVKEVQPLLDRNCIRCHKDRTASPIGANAQSYAGIDLKNAKTLSPIGSEWRSTTGKPQKGWQSPKFDDSKWQVASGGFGRRGTPGGRIKTQWHTRDIWLRRTFDLPAEALGKKMAFNVCHDEDFEVYVNGVLAASARGYITRYRPLLMNQKAMAALKTGTNHLALHCRQTRGGQFIDLALLALPSEKEVTPETPKDKLLAFSLLGEQTEDRRAKRNWSDAYLALTQAGTGNSVQRGRSDGRLVNWVSAQSVPDMLPPLHRGAAKSELITLLEKGHHEVKLTQEEMDKLVCWIDLSVPYCGDYTEANTWSESEKAKYARYLKKRRDMEAIERENIRAFLSRNSE